MARGRCTTNSPLDSARTVDVLVCPASSSNALNVNGDRNKIPSADESPTNPPGGRPAEGLLDYVELLVL